MLLPCVPAGYFVCGTLVVKKDCRYDTGWGEVLGRVTQEVFADSECQQVDGRGAGVVHHSFGNARRDLSRCCHEHGRGAFSALVAPQIFSTVAEYPLAIVLALLLRPGPLRAKPGLLNRHADILLPFGVLVSVLVTAKALPEGGNGRLVLFVAVGVVALFAGRPIRFALGIAALLLIIAIPKASLVSDRSFFGTLLVIQDGPRHVLFHGSYAFTTTGR